MIFNVNRMAFQKGNFKFAPQVKNISQRERERDRDRESEEDDRVRDLF